MYPCNKVEEKRERKRWGEDWRERNRTREVGVSRKGETKKKGEKVRMTKTLLLITF